MDRYPKRLRTWLPTSSAGAIIALSYLYWLNNQDPLQGLTLLLVFLYLWTFFCVLVYFLFVRIVIPRLEKYSFRWKSLWLAGCILAGLWLTHNIPLLYPHPLEEPFAFPGIYKLFFLCSAGFSIGLLLFAISVLFATRATLKETSTAKTRFRWVLYALPMLIVWLIYLLAFWPGMMSADSLDQWGQILSGQFSDHHPAFHTFTLWLLTRIYLSPAIIALAQILTLGLLAGTILAYFETLGAPPLVLWAASFILAFSPVNGTMVNTLWKDIPYSITLLGFTFLVLRVVRSRGIWISTGKNWLILGLTSALVALFRHNGWPVVIATFLLAFLAYPKLWKSLVFSFVLGAGVYFGIRGPVYQLAKVNKSGVYSDASSKLFPIYSIATHASPGTEIEAIFASIRPFSKNWDCSIITSLEEAVQRDNLDTDEHPLQATLNLVKRSPNMVLYYYRCRRSFLWTIWDPFGFFDNASHAQYWIDPNPYGIVPDSKIPSLQEKISRFVVETSTNADLNWFVWRPALFLYLFIFIISILTLKSKDIKSLLVAAPILIQTIGFTITFTSPRFRLHYAIYLAALLFWPLLFTSVDPPANQLSTSVMPGGDSLPTVSEDEKKDDRSPES